MTRRIVAVLILPAILLAAQPLGGQVGGLCDRIYSLDVRGCNQSLRSSLYAAGGTAAVACLPAFLTGHPAAGIACLLTIGIQLALILDFVASWELCLDQAWAVYQLCLHCEI